MGGGKIYWNGKKCRIDCISVGKTSIYVPQKGNPETQKEQDSSEGEKDSTWKTSPVTISASPPHV